MNKQPTQHTDYKYIKALLTNDHLLIKEIYQKFSHKILRLVQKNSGTAKDAQDLFQEALMDIYEQGKKANFKLTCPFDAYIYYICRNKWLNQLRKKKNAGMQVTISDIEQYTGTTDAISLAEETSRAQNQRRLFVEMLGQLGESCKNILSRNWKGMALDVIAKELDISYGYARKKKVTCIARLTKLVRNHPSYNGLIVS